jgi:ATP-dependent helicase HrpB
MLLMADSPERKSLAADIAALLEEKDPLSERADAGIDLRLTELRKARQSGRGGRWTRILRIAEQYTRLCRVEPDNQAPDAYEAGFLIASAYPERIGRAWKEGGPGRLLLSGGEQMAVEASDVLTAYDWVAVASMSSRPGGVGRVFLAAPVMAEDLNSLATERDAVFWDRAQGCAVARRERRIGVHLLDSRPLSDESVREKMLTVIVEAAKKEGVSMFDFSEEVENLQRRVGAVAAWHPELELPDLSTEAVLERAGEWIPLYIGKATSVAQLKRLDLTAVLWGMLSYEQQQAVDRLAPTHITVPTGSRIRLEYRQGAEAPVLRVRLQECFGLLDTPRVDDGRLPVLMELLSPGYKPVQLTTDLRSFWSGTYFEVKKELKRRYPKHAWPDNPLEADPVRGVKRTK